MLSLLCFQNLQICSLTHAKPLRLISTQTSKSLHMSILLFLLFCSTHSSCFTIQNSSFCLFTSVKPLFHFLLLCQKSSGWKQGRLGVVQSLSWSDSLRPHGLQDSKLLCPSPSPGACSNSCPLSRWCDPDHLILYCPLLLPSIFPSIWVFSSESALCIR